MLLNGVKSDWREKIGRIGAVDAALFGAAFLSMI